MTQQVKPSSLCIRVVDLKSVLLDQTTKNDTFVY